MPLDDDMPYLSADAWNVLGRLNEGVDVPREMADRLRPAEWNAIGRIHADRRTIQQAARVQQSGGVGRRGEFDALVSAALPAPVQYQSPSPQVANAADWFARNPVQGVLASQNPLGIQGAAPAMPSAPWHDELVLRKAERDIGLAEGALVRDDNSPSGYSFDNGAGQMRPLSRRDWTLAQQSLTPSGSEALNATDIPVIGSALQLVRGATETPEERAYREYNAPRVHGLARAPLAIGRFARDMVLPGDMAVRATASGLEQTDDPAMAAGFGAITAAFNKVGLKGADKVAPQVVKALGDRIMGRALSAGTVQAAGQLSGGAVNGLVVSEGQALSESLLRAVDAARHAGEMGQDPGAVLDAAIGHELTQFVKDQPEIAGIGAIGGAVGHLPHAAASFFGRGEGAPEAPPQPRGQGDQAVESGLPGVGAVRGRVVGEVPAEPVTIDGNRGELTGRVAEDAGHGASVQAHPDDLAAAMEMGRRDAADGHEPVPADMLPPEVADAYLAGYGGRTTDATERGGAARDGVEQASAFKEPSNGQEEGRQEGLLSPAARSSQATAAGDSSLAAGPASELGGRRLEKKGGNYATGEGLPTDGARSTEALSAADQARNVAVPAADRPAARGVDEGVAGVVREGGEAPGAGAGDVGAVERMNASQLRAEAERLGVSTKGGRWSTIDRIKEAQANEYAGNTQQPTDSLAAGRGATQVQEGAVRSLPEQAPEGALAPSGGTNAPRDGLSATRRTPLGLDTEAGRTARGGGGTVSRLDAIEQAALQRLKTRQLPRGRNVGASIIGAELRDRAIIAAVRVVKAGVRTAEAINEAVRKVAEELGVTHTDTEHRQVFEVARQIVRRAGRDGSALEQAVAESEQRHPEYQEGVKVGAAQEANKAQTRRTDDQRKAELDALRANIQGRAKGFDQGVRAGRKEEAEVQRSKAKAEMNLANQTIRVLTQTLKSTTDQATRKEAKAKAVADLRKQVQSVVEKALPVSQRGEFLNAVRTADTPADMRSVVRRVERAVLDGDRRRVEQQVKRTDTAETIKVVRVDDRNDFKNAASAARASLAAAKQVLGHGSGALRALERHIDNANVHMAEMARLYADAKAENKQTKLGNAKTLADARMEMRNNLQVTAKAMKASADGVSDVGPGAEATELGRTAGSLKDVFKVGDMLTVAQRMEAGVDPDKRVLSDAFKAFLDADEKKQSRKRDMLAELEQIAKDAGYEDLADAQVKGSGILTDGTTDRREVRLNGQTYKFRVAQLMEMLGHLGDSETLDLTERGMPVVSDDGRTQRTIYATADQWRLAISKTLSPAERAVAPKVTDWIAKSREDVFKAAQEMEGRAPEAVEGYYPRTRDRGIDEPSTGQQNIQSPTAQWNRLKDRQGGTKLPLVLGDIWSTAIDYADGAAHTIEMMPAVLQAHRLIRGREERTLISQRFGPEMVKRLEAFVNNAASRGGPVPTKGGVVVRYLNSLRGSAQVALRPTTMLNQAVGITRLAGYLSPREMADGLAGAAKVKMSDLKKSSGYLWERYTGDPMRRLSAVTGGTGTGSAVGVGRALRAFGGAVSKGRVSEAFEAYRQMAGSIKVLDWFDALPAKVIYAAMDAKARRENPGWSAAERTKWVGEQTGRLVRETANASSPLDHGYNQMVLRGTLESGLLLFKSDTIKAWNRLQRARVDGNWKVWSAEAANLVLNVAVKRGWQAGLIALGATAAGNDPELEKLNRQLKDPMRWLGDIGQEGAGMALPVGGDDLTSIARTLTSGGNLQENSPFDSAIFSAYKSVARVADDLRGYLSALSDEDKAKAHKRLARLVLNALDTGSELAGNPLHPYVQYGEKVYRSATNPADREYFIGEAFNAIKKGKADDATESLVQMFHDVPRSKWIDTKNGLRTSLLRKGPLGKVTAEERLKYLKSLPPAEREKQTAAYRAWVRDVSRILPPGSDLGPVLRKVREEAAARRE